MNEEQEEHKAWLLAEQRNFAGAEKLLRQALGRNPRSVWAHSYLAYCLTEQQRFDEAIEQGRCAVAAGPNYGYAHFTLGRTLMMCSRFEESIGPAIEGARLEPLIARRHALVADILTELELYAQAWESAERGIATAPNDAECYRIGAMPLARLARHADARAAMDTAMRLEPGSPWNLFCDGYVRLYGNDPTGAVASLREAMSIDPMNAWSHQCLASALAILGDLAGADAEFAEALRINPHLITARRGRAGLKHWMPVSGLQVTTR